MHSPCFSGLLFDAARVPCYMPKTDKHPPLPLRTLMNRALSFLLIMLLLATGVIESLHHHADGADHADCSICAGAHHQSDAVSVPTVAAQPVAVSRTPFSLSNLLVPAGKCYSPANNRAPPA